MRRRIATRLFLLALRVDTQWTMRMAGGLPDIDWETLRLEERTGLQFTKEPR